MNNAWRNIRHGVRLLARNKGFTAVAVLALALGIGPNVAIFSVVWSTFFTRTYPNENQLVVVWTKIKGERGSSRADDFVQYLNQSKSFQHLDFFAWVDTHLTSEDASEEPISGTIITPGFYTKNLGTTMMMGRDLLPEEGVPGNDHVVILSHRLWRERFRADPHIVGQQIKIDDQSYTVVGVLNSDPADTSGFTIPFAASPGRHDPRNGNIFGRLRPGVTLAQAQAELNTIDQQLGATRESHFLKSDWSVGVEPMRNDWLDKKSERNLWLLLAAVGFVLLIACTNVANMLLAKGTDRQREIAVRAALGASHRQVFAQLFTESLTLAILGGMTGIGLGWGLLKLIKALLGGTLLQVTDASLAKVNMPVLLFAMGLTVIAACLFGCAPAWHAMRVNLSDSLKEGSQAVVGGKRFGTQSAFVIVQFALALTLLAGAGMASHNFWKLGHADIGIRPDHLLICNLSVNDKDIPNPELRTARARQLFESLRAIPGTQNAALTTSVPFQGYESDPFSIVGQPNAETYQRAADVEMVTPSYFDTFGVRLVAGRFLTDEDDVSGPLVAVVSDSFVRRYLQHLDPLDQRVIIPWGQKTSKELQIVGVFHDIRNGEHLNDEAQPMILASFWQLPVKHPTLALRSTLDASAMVKPIRRAVVASEPGMLLTRIETMDEILRNQTGGNRFEAFLFGGFASLALFLAALGIYGVMAFAVARRRNEIGLRMALGAQQQQVVWLILIDGMKPALFGMCAGLIGVYVLGRLMHSALYGVATVDLDSLAPVVSVLLLSALVATYIPARRSSRVDPVAALRQD